MPLIIEPIQQEDITELRTYLLKGFHESADSEVFSSDVLLWKYFDPRGEDGFPRGFVARKGGNIVGFIGLCPSVFMLSGSLESIPTVTAIDWLATERGAHVGSTLMEKVFMNTRFQYMIGGTTASKKAFNRLGFKPCLDMPIFGRTLRPLHHFRQPRQSPVGKALLKMIRDYGRKQLRRKPSTVIELRRVHAFGDEVRSITDACRMDAVTVERSPELMNHFLRYPRQTISGWHLMRNGTLVGFALLSVVQRGPRRVGKIVDCFLNCIVPEVWHSAMDALTQELGSQAADSAVSYGTTPWMEIALKLSGYVQQGYTPLVLRDPENLIPTSSRFYLTMMEADHAYF